MLDAVSRLRELIKQTEGLNCANFSPLTGISNSTVAELLSGKRTASGRDEEKISDAVRFVQTVNDALSPFPVNWRATNTLLRLKTEFDIRGESAFASIAQTTKTLAPQESNEILRGVTS